VKGATNVTVNKWLLVIAGVVLLFIAGGALGPAPLLPGLGPPFDGPLGFLFAVVIAGGAIWMITTLGKSRSSDSGRRDQPSAEYILRERFARGEVDRARFEQMLSDLGHDLPRKA
jgi:putative membrane protein